MTYIHPLYKSILQINLTLKKLIVLFRLKVSFLLISLAIVKATKLYDKRDDFNFPVVNFPFICINIPAARANGEYISKTLKKLIDEMKIIYIYKYKNAQ
jgi:hypothetical protein